MTTLSSYMKTSISCTMSKFFNRGSLKSYNVIAVIVTIVAIIIPSYIDILYLPNTSFYFCFAHIYIHVWVYECIHVCVCICVYVHVYIYNIYNIYIIYITYIHIYIYIYIYIYPCASVCKTKTKTTKILKCIKTLWKVKT